MSNVFFSVVVPVYGIPINLLRGCLNSLKDQSFRDVEFLIIDDGSPDECGSICDEFEAVDNRFKVYHIKNSGVSVARNHGLKNSNGKYILFVDADDRIPEELLSELFTFYQKDNANTSIDLLFLKYEVVNESGLVFETASTKSSALKMVDDIKLAIASGSDGKGSLSIPNVVYGTPWGKVFKRSFLTENNILFPLGIKKRQDAVFMLSVLANAPLIQMFDIVGYYWVSNPGSITNKFNSNIEKIHAQSLAAIRQTIEVLYSGLEKDSLLSATDSLEIKLIFEGLRLNLAHPDCSLDLNERRRLFVESCRKSRRAIINCNLKLLPDKGRKIAAICLKAKCYSFVFWGILLRQKINKNRR